MCLVAIFITCGYLAIIPRQQKNKHPASLYINMKQDTTRVPFYIHRRKEIIFFKNISIITKHNSLSNTPNLLHIMHQLQILWQTKSRVILLETLDTMTDFNFKGTAKIEKLLHYMWKEKKSKCELTTQCIKTQLLPTSACLFYESFILRKEIRENSVIM